MQRKTFSGLVRGDIGSTFDCHQLEIVTSSNIFSIPFDQNTKGSQIIEIIESFTKEKYVISSKNPQLDVCTPIYVSENIKKIKSLIPDNDKFISTPLIKNLVPSRILGSRNQRFSLLVESIDDYLINLQFKKLKRPIIELFKNTHKTTINVELPYGTNIDVEINKSNTIKHIQRNVYEEMQRIYGKSNIPSIKSYKLGTIDKKYFPSSKSLFCDCPKMMEALRFQMQNKNETYFALVAVGRNSFFNETINKDAEELDLQLPHLTLETQALYASLSVVRHEVESQRNSKISVNPLLARMRLSKTDPPLFTCKKETVAMKCELRGGITESACTRASIQVNHSITADEAIKSLIYKIEKHQKIVIEKEWDNFVLLLQGTDEVIAGNYPLVEFVCVRQFLISNQPVMNVILAEKSHIIESIRKKELAVRPMPEPAEGDFIPSVSVSGKSLCIPNLNINTKLSIFINSFNNVPKKIKRIGCHIAIINGTESISDIQELPYARGGMANIVFNRNVEFNIAPRSLPRTARISITLYDVDKRESLKKKPPKKQGELGAIASMNYPMFTHDGWINVGWFHTAMWNNHNMDYILTCCQSSEPGAVIANFRLPRYRYPVYHKVPVVDNPKWKTTTLIIKEDMMRIQALENADPLEELTIDDKNLVWANRGRFVENPMMLPLVLESIDYTCPTQVGEIPYILDNWAPIPPKMSIMLLDAKFPDAMIRAYAVKHLDAFNDSEIMLYMLQLVQALKYELYDDSDLLRFLLKRGLAEPKFIGHQLFWQLMSEAHISHIRKRFSAIVVNFMYGIGSYRKELKTGYRFTQKLVELNADLCKLNHNEATEQFRIRLKEIEIPEEFHLPMDPRLIVDSFIIEKCKVMNSKKKPFWLTFHNAAPFSTEPVLTMFKVGDDLRQDQLTLQIMKVMEHLWRENQMDLRMNCYSVLPTGLNQGFIEVVPNAVTEQSLQQEEGRWTGVFKSNIMNDFLKHNNSTDVTLKIAKENFLLSSSGYAVSSCVLGIADRHPGNIMVQTDGHFFHIDFGHFLGNFKKKLGYQRENAPFHFSPACAEALGGVGSESYKKFEEINGKAFNILRANANLLISIMLLMLGTGIPELQKPGDIIYMKEKLALNASDAEAIEIFRGYSNQSLESTKTAINNWIHNLVVS